MRRMVLFAAAVMLLLSSCASENGSQTVSGADTSSKAVIQTEYEQISREEAQRIMDSGENIIILDVRTEEEFAQGHIPNAICIPNETITDDNIPELPDKEQTILVYCRSGRRSKEASGKLASYGYTNITNVDVPRLFRRRVPYVRRWWV